VPLHVYKCGVCSAKHEEFRAMGSDVSTACCPRCLNISHKSWDLEDLPHVEPNIEPYFCEQLGVHISSRQGLRDAMHKIEVETDGRTKLEWK